MNLPGVTIPLVFLRDTLPAITNNDELLVSLALFRLISQSESSETPVAEVAVMHDDSLRSALRNTGGVSSLDARIFDALEIAVGRETFLRFMAVSGERESAWYFANTTVTRSLVRAMLQGRVPAPRVVWEDSSAPVVIADPPNIFRLYEQNIGALTPIIADQITLAVSEYPATWIEEAIAEAVSYNKRSWRYILRILENWRQDGRVNNP